MTQKKLPLRQILSFSAPGLPLAAILLVVAVYLPRFYVGLGVKFVAVGLAILMVRVIDILFDPFIGLAMDRTRTAIGRYRPWLLAGAPVAMLGLYELLLPSGKVDALHLGVWLLVAYAGYSMINLCLAAWSTGIAATYDERSRLWGWTQGLAVLGSIALQYVPSFSVSRLQATFSRQRTAVQIGVLSFALLGITTFGPAGVAPFIYYRF